jgi:excisionase family DNA binding protein
MKYLNSKEVAMIMGVHVSTVKRWTDAGKLPCYQTPGGHRKFILRHINEFLAKNKKKSKKVNIVELEGVKDRKLIQNIDHGEYEKLLPVFIKQALNADGNRLKTTLTGLYMKQYLLHEIYDALVMPVLESIGDMWANNDISVAEEHLASNTIRNAVYALGETLERKDYKDNSYTLSLALSGDEHDLPLIMTKQILEIKGIPVINCGRNTPANSIKRLLKKFQPDKIIVSLTYIEDKKLAKQELDDLLKIASKTHAKIYVGGAGIQYINGQQLKNVQLLHSMSDVAQI